VTAQPAHTLGQGVDHGGGAPVPARRLPITLLLETRRTSIETLAPPASGPEGVNPLAEG
jgi:hypothetical protein